MDITKMNARDAIAAAYSGTPSVIWEFASADKKQTFAKVKKYCPGCKQAGTLRDIEPGDDNNQCRYKCRSCGHLCRFPKALVPKGPNHSSSHVSRVNPGARIARAMEASEIMAAVESLPVELRLWALWMYTDPGQAAAEQIEGKVLAYFVKAMDKVERDHLRGLQANANAIRVISMAMNCFRHVKRCDRKLYNAASYAEAIGRDRSQFDGDRLWGRVLSAITDKMIDVDRRALRPVADVLRDLRGENVA